MATWDTTGEDALRAENVDAVIKGYARQKFIFKNLVMTPASSSWSESYYTESSTSLTPVSGIPRGAAFPQAFPSWTKSTAYMKKVGLATEVLWEDRITNNIDVIARSLERVGDAVVKSVDSSIETALRTGAGNTVAASATWNNATRSSRIPHEDIFKAIDAIIQDNYDPDFIMMNPTNFAYFASNDYVLDSYDATGPSVLGTGDLGNFAGLRVLKSSQMTLNTVLVGKAKTCGTYRIAEPLRTVTEDVIGIKTNIRAWEIGTCFVTDPNALCTITGC